jgi:hypothetical protein
MVFPYELTILGNRLRGNGWISLRKRGIKGDLEIKNLPWPLFSKEGKYSGFPLKKVGSPNSLPLRKRGREGDLEIKNLPWPLFSKEGK